MAAESDGAVTPGATGEGQGVRDLYGFADVAVAAGGEGFGATRPVPGTGWIVAAHLVAGRLDATPLPGMVLFTLYWNDIVPTSGLELEAGEEVFPLLSGPSNATGRIAVATDGGGFAIWGPFAVEPRGRMLTARFQNIGPEDVAAGLFVVFERCSAAPTTRAKGLGACWA